MFDTINNIKNKSAKQDSIFGDELINIYYNFYFDNLSSKQLDMEFNKDVLSLAKVFSKLKETEKKNFINLFSRYIEFYIERKFEKELELSFNKIFKI